VSLSHRIRLGAVEYLNARPLVYGLDAVPRFDLRYDIPSVCARLLHDGAIDVGLIPSIEYLRGPRPYALVPGPAVTSRGPVASVAIYTRVEPRDIKTIAMDNSSRTSVALATVLLRRVFGVTPEPVSMAPDLDAMLANAEAALLIGDYALFLDHATVRTNSTVRLKPDTTFASAIRNPQSEIQKIDLGELWTRTTGLPFVYACWTGTPEVLNPADVEALQRAGDEGAAHSDAVARAYYAGDTARQAIASRYLRDNIRYKLGPEELEGLHTFYRFAAELGLASFDGILRQYHAEHHPAR
jgi:chorismate dehydratase